MTEFKKPTRYLEQQTTNQGFDKPSLYGVSGNVIYGGESNANFIDVISVGPVTSVESVYVNDTNIDSGEFPLSEFYPHTGDDAEELFEGNFPYVERSYSISKQADLTEGEKGAYNTTTFTRSVSGKGVAGVRLIFNAPQFLHKDTKNRRKEAKARFSVYILDENGSRVKTASTGNLSFYSNNAVSTQLTILAREEDLERTWDYEVEMSIRVNMYSTVVSGSWTAAIVTEFFKETQTYKDVATVSGKVVSNDVAGSLPKREYLVNGYKVDVPVYIGENNLFLGEFTKATSDSHAWNAMAVLVDTKWGAGLPIDKINIASFVEFDKYISETLEDGEPRFKHSQELIKADSYFRIASQIVGAADGKLFEDTSGRIGVLIDRQTDSRRIITSYDIQNEKVKRTTVPEKKKTNYVEITYVDEDNEYQADIYTVQDDIAITKNGLISEKLKSDTCTRSAEARRLANKVLVTSQVASTSYVFTVGHTHEDIQIGEVVALYDRVYSRVNYCGKVGEGSSLNQIRIDNRTPINLEGITNPYIVFDNSRGVPLKYKIASWTDKTVNLETSMGDIPEPFTSFGIESGDDSGLKPSLVKVLGVTDNAGVLQVEGVEYNDSLYSHIENGTPLLIPATRIIPKLQDEVTGLGLVKTSTGISANWDDSEDGVYVYIWKKYTGDTERDPNGTGIIVESGQTPSSTSLITFPLEPARYEISVYILNEETGQSSGTKSASILVDVTDGATSTISPPTNLDTTAGNGEYLGRGFTVQWDQEEDTETTPYLMGYILRVTQGENTLEVRLTSGYRSYQVTSQSLTETFGENYGREFVVRLIAYDDTLKTTPTVTRIVNNAAPQAPTVGVRVTGDLILSSEDEIPEDVIGSVVYLWESSDINSTRPETALEFDSNLIAEIDLPNGTLVYDNRDYVFEAAWVDGFGKDGATYGRSQIAFGPDVLIPEPMTLVQANAYTITSVQVEFEHDGVWLEKMKVYYRKSNEGGAFTLDDTYTFDGTDTRVTYDEGTQQGSFVLDTLDYNSEYEIYTTVSNISSVDSEASETVIGNTVPYANVDDIREDLNEIRDDILSVRDDVDGTLKPQLNLEILSRQGTDKELFNTTAALASFRRNITDEFNTLRDATFEINPNDGTIGLRAYNYTDTQFAQAGVLIDGVDAKVSINASRIEEVNGGVIDANASIDVLAGQIELKASYTEMTEYVSGALDAIIPAYSFGFFNSTEGWYSVNGVITQGNSLITTTWGDIENQTLSYSADDNPIITLGYMRTAGSGFTGDLFVTFENGNTQRYPDVISDISVGNTNVQSLNLSEDATYTGTVTGLRLVLGASIDDEWEIDSITIGKPSAQLEALDGITVQVNQLGVDIDAIEGQLTSFVTTTYYDENTVTLNNVTQVLDGEDAIISLKATQQELNEEGTITKANSASIWVDGADANIRTSVISFNAEDGGINDQIAGLQGDLSTVTQELSTIDGAKIRSNLVSINRIETKTKDLDELQFYTELKLLDQKNRDLELGESVATVDTQVKALSTDQGALAQELLELTASTGVIEGQVTASVTRISQAETDISGNAQAITALTTEVENTQGDLSDAQLVLDSTVDELGVVSSRAYLGVSTTVDGKTTVTGITADSSTNGLRFQGDVIQFDDTAGNPALQYRSDLDKWAFNGQLVVGGYTVNSEEDIRALDGDTIYETYQYSATGDSGWHEDFVDGDLYRRTATITNGVASAWSTATRITGYTPEIINNPDGSVTISNGTETAIIYDGENAPIPTLTDNGDGTYTIDNGAGDAVTVSNGSDGAAGYNNANIYLYQRSSTVPSKPTASVVYNFNTKAISGANNGWETSVPNGSDDLYVIVATASSQSDVDTIPANEWTEPSVMATDGANGLNVATVFIYKRSLTTPALPTTNGTFRFSDGILSGINNGWSQTIPSGSDPVYITTATASSQEATDTIPAGEWAAPEILAQNGETPVKGVDYFDGLDGSFVSNIYRTYSTGAPPTPTGGSFDGVDEEQPDNWQDTPYYVSGEITYISTARYREVSSGAWQHDGWSTPSEYIIKGDKGDSSVNFYTSAGDFSFDGTNYVKQGSAGWNTGFNSEEKFIHASASCRISSTAQIVLGLSESSSQGFFGDVQYGLFADDGVLKVIELGSSKGSFGSITGASTLTVLWDGISVKYYRDSTLLYTSATKPTGKVLFDLCAFQVGDTFADPEFYLAGSGGESGQVGAGFYGSTYSSISWTTSTASSRFASLVGRNPVDGDIFTQTRTDGVDSQARQYNGSSWVAVALQVNGSIVASNTIAGDKLIAGTEISSPKVVGGEVIGAKVATSSGNGLRVELEDDGTYMQWIGTGAKTDLNALFYVKSNGEGFIKGDFFQGEIVSSESASNLTTGTSTSTVTHNSNGKSIKIDGSGNVNFNAVGDYQDQLVGSIEIVIRRGGTTLNSVSAPLYGLLYDSFNNRTTVSGSVNLSALDTQSVGDFAYSASVSTNFTGQTTGSIQTYSQVSTFENLIA